MELTSGEWVTITIFLAGAIFAALAHYLRFMSEFNYIKGQLSQILEMHERITELTENHAKMEKDVHKHAKDLDKAFLRIKIMEHKTLGVSL